MMMTMRMMTMFINHENEDGNLQIMTVVMKVDDDDDDV